MREWDGHTHIVLHLTPLLSYFLPPVWLIKDQSCAPPHPTNTHYPSLPFTQPHPPPLTNAVWLVKDQSCSSFFSSGSDIHNHPRFSKISASVVLSQETVDGAWGVVYKDGEYRVYGTPHHPLTWSVADERLAEGKKGGGQCRRNVGMERETPQTRL